MGVSARHRPRWWIYLLASIYVLTFAFNARQEAFGPADSGLRYTGQLPDHRPLAVESVVAGSPFDLAGVRAGDVIETVAGRVVLGQTDWLLARAHFERNQATDVQVRRGGVHQRFRFTITKPNWTTWGRGVVAFQLARAFVLFVALWLAFKRPDDLSVRLAALIFAMIAVAEAFPSAGWAAALVHLPPILSLPIASATVSWLLITVPWFSLCVVFPQTLFTRRWAWALVLAPVAFFLPLIVVSAVAVIYRPAMLAMPTPFLDTSEIRLIQKIWGVIPSLFINPWPFYIPTRQTWLLELWVAVSLSAWVAGYVTLVAMCFRVREQPERRRLRMLAVGLVMVWIIGIHNVLVRNWGAVLGDMAPAVLSAAGLIAEAIVFSFVVLMLAYALITHRRAASRT
jgi:PDZ domain